MTGIYLFGKDANGKRAPIEIEHLTDAERADRFLKAGAEDALRFLHAICDKLIEMDEFLKKEQYTSIITLDIEYFTEDERNDYFLDKPQEEILEAMNTLCVKLVYIEKFLEAEGYVAVDPFEELAEESDARDIDVGDFQEDLSKALDSDTGK